MTSFLGNFLLIGSLISAFLQFILCRKKNNINIINYIKKIVIILFLLIFLSFLLLIYAHVTSDFSLINVYQNSHTTKPLLYKVSGVWGNHEGSMILWIFILSIFNYFLSSFSNSKNYFFIFKALEVQAIIIIGFILFTIFTSNPFIAVDVIKQNGLGFNPILQDPALAIHPPLLYIGYVGFSATFSISIAALSLETNKNFPWYNYMKPLVLIAWTFLTIGIALGALWAYYELGWGGWWFWDPVENASLMPWLLGTALLHSLIVVERKKSLQTWVLLLAILTFLLSVFGTFLVRSGILTSVHAFALDASRGIYILLFTAFLSVYSLFLYAVKSKKFINEDYFSFVSKEGSILANNIFMVIVCSTVFLGTIYPLLIEALTKSKISVGEPYFNSTVVPILIPAIVIMGVGPILSWGNESKLKVFIKILPSILLSITATTLFFIFYKSFSLLGIIGIFLSSWIIINNLVLLLKKLLLLFKFNIQTQSNILKHSAGMIIAHIGVGFLILGITGSSIWQKEKIMRMNLGDEAKIKQYKVLFKGINEIKGLNYLALRGNFVVYDKSRTAVAEMYPENRFYPISNNFTTEVSINTNLMRDLYIVLGEGNKNDGWIIRIYHNPLVVWIWIGSLAIFLGGLTSILSNSKKLKKVL